MRPRRITGYMQWCFHLAAALSLLLAIYLAAVSFSARRQPKIIGFFANFKLETNPKVRQQLQDEEWHAGPAPGLEFPIWACHFTGTCVVFARHRLAVRHTRWDLKNDAGSESGQPHIDDHSHLPNEPTRIGVPVWLTNARFMEPCRVDARAVQVGAASLRLMPVDDSGPCEYRYPLFPDDSIGGRLGVSVEHPESQYTYRSDREAWGSGTVEGERFNILPLGDYLRVRYWMVLVPLAILPALWIVCFSRAYRLRRRVRLGLCINCGYDLRASPSACPECGAPSTPSRA